ADRGLREGLMPDFVVHEHKARKLHWDLRLELDGVLASWAVPKEPPNKAGVRRLAIRVEDHPIEYKDFEGVIPEGNYGAGTVKIWDRGGYSIIERAPTKLEILMDGKILKGKYVLLKFDKGGKDAWLFFKVRD
ncbi:MAG: DNA polymerase ligase N-terminal domain-containing protein, partial [Candidatus Methanomethylicaceae archaeon]